MLQYESLWLCLGPLHILKRPGIDKRPQPFEATNRYMSGALGSYLFCKFAHYCRPSPDKEAAASAFGVPRCMCVI